MLDEPDDLVVMYWRYFALSTSDRRKDRLLAVQGGDDRASEWVDEAASSGRNEAVDLIERLARAAPDDAAVAYLGAGPLENLLNNHGVRLLDELEQAARRSKPFRAALATVWYSGASPTVLDRLHKFGLNAL